MDFGGRIELGGDFFDLGEQHGCLFLGAAEFFLQLGELIPGKSESGFAQVGLDGGGPARGFGLACEGFELAAEFAGEVGEPVEVGLHADQFALGFFFTTAVFEHARGFFDEGSAFFWSGFEYLGESALAHDDVHFSADAGVGEEFLDVHEAGFAAVDFVFGGAVAEHAAGDGDFGVVDVEGAVGVVDGEGDFGSA